MSKKQFPKVNRNEPQPVKSMEEVQPVDAPTETEWREDQVADHLGKVLERPDLPPELRAALEAGPSGPIIPVPTVFPTTAAAAQAAAAGGDRVDDAFGREIKPYRYCPICWGRHKGYGTVRSTSETKSYLRCDQALTDLGPCGHTWSVEFVEDVYVVRSKRPLPPGSTR